MKLARFELSMLLSKVTKRVRSCAMLHEAHMVGVAVEGVAVVGACVGVEVGAGDGARLHANG